MCWGTRAGPSPGSGGEGDSQVKQSQPQAHTTSHEHFSVFTCIFCPTDGADFLEGSSVHPATRLWLVHLCTASPRAQAQEAGDE